MNESSFLTLEEENAILRMANSTTSFIGSRPKPEEKSVASSLFVSFQENPEHLSAKILDFPQSYLLIAAEQVRLVPQILQNFRSADPKVPLPQFSFYVNARVAVENSVLIVWLFSNHELSSIYQRGYLLAKKEERSLKGFAYRYHKILCDSEFKRERGRPSFHKNDGCKANWDYLERLAKALDSSATELDLDTRAVIPNFIETNSGKQSIFEEIHEQPWQLLYTRLSGIVHGNSWAMHVNTIKSEAETLVNDSGVRTVTLTPDYDFLKITVTLAAGILDKATKGYRSIFLNEARG